MNDQILKMLPYAIDWSITLQVALNIERPETKGTSSERGNPTSPTQFTNPPILFSFFSCLFVLFDGL